MFEAKMKLLKEYCEKAKDPSQTGGPEMNLSEFIKLSWGEKSSKVVEAVDAEYSHEYFTLLVDMFDDRVIMRFYSYADGSCKLMSVDYSMDENGAVTLGNIKEVHVTYEDLPEPAPAVSNAETLPTGEDNGASEPDVPTNATETTVTDEVPPAADANVTPTEITNATDTTDADAAPAANTAEPQPDEPAPAEESNFEGTTAAQDTDADNTQPTKVGAVDEQKQEENSSSAPLTDGERAEFEALKREKKENLLNSYKDYLSEEEYNGYFASIDTSSEEELENKLLKARVAFEEEQKAKVSRPFSLSAFLNPNKKYESKESELAAEIRNILGR